MPKKKFSIIEFTAQQRALAEKVLGKWHNLVEEAHDKLREGMTIHGGRCRELLPPWLLVG